MWNRIDERAIELWWGLNSLQMIADVFGVSRAGVKKYLNRHGIDTGKRKWDATCNECGVVFKKARCQIRANRFSYCTMDCYIASMRNPDYNENRQGQRVARKLVKVFFPLEPDHVVHHKDGDTTNNYPSNQMVFRNHGEHMRWHRGDRSLVEPLWDGKRP